jgi:hypothetical protein
LENDRDPSDEPQTTADEKPNEATVGGDEHSAPDAPCHRCNGRREQKHPLEFAIALLLFGTLVATSFAACYTRKQWLTAADSEVRQLRAYVSPATGANQLGQPLVRLTNDGGAPLAWVTARNDGQTPALHFVITIAILKLPLPLADNYEYPVRITFRQPTLAPRGEDTTTYHGYGIDIAAILPQLQTKTFAIYVYGTMTYQDVFKNPHFTNYCFFYSPPSVSPTDCDHHNDTDDAPEDKG